SNKHHRLSAAGVLVALGIIYGDIGTSPIYTFGFIVGKNPVSKELIFGGLSCVFWTLTIITSFKYVYLALRADNKGEGGIFALYALVRRYKVNWVIFPAIIGCCTLIA
ncbi:MAG: KUP/HAK/KT family potassium transporter, partial [Flammeovirgaceae bacterium]